MFFFYSLHFVGQLALLLINDVQEEQTLTAAAVAHGPIDLRLFVLKQER